MPSLPPPPTPILGIYYNVSMTTPSAGSASGTVIVYDDSPCGVRMEQFPAFPVGEGSSTWRIVRYGDVPKELCYVSLGSGVTNQGAYVGGYDFSRAQIVNLPVVDITEDISSLTSGNYIGVESSGGVYSSNSYTIEGALNSSGTPLFGVYTGTGSNSPKLAMTVSSTFNIDNYLGFKSGHQSHNGIFGDIYTVSNLYVVKYVDILPSGLEHLKIKHWDPAQEKNVITEIAREVLNAAIKCDNVAETVDAATLLKSNLYSVGLSVIGDLTYTPAITPQTTYLPSLSDASDKLKALNTSAPTVTDKSIKGIMDAADDVNIIVYNKSIKGCLDAIDAPNIVTNVPGTWIDISTTGTDLQLSDDQHAIVNNPNGNDFIPSGDYAITANGAIFINDRSSTYYHYNNTSLTPSLFNGAKVLLPYWDDLDTKNFVRGKVLYKVVGTTFVVQWENIGFYDDPDDVVRRTFQVQIPSGTGPVKAQFLYKDVESGTIKLKGSTATVGYQDQTHGIQFSVNTESLSNNMVLSIKKLSLVPEPIFTIDSAGTITAYNSDIGGLAVVIPDTINGISVKIVGPQVFLNMAITSVSFPEGLTEIGEDAFGGTALTSVTFPSTLTKISARAFMDSPSLTSLTFSSAATVKEYAFNGCPIDRVDTDGLLTIVNLAGFPTMGDRGNEFITTYNKYLNRSGLYTDKYGVWTYGEAFLTPGTFNWNSGRYDRANGVVIGGGGGGASGGQYTLNGGGYGGKGAFYNTFFDGTLAPNTNYTVVVGAGGAGGTATYDGSHPGESGQASSFRDIVAGGGAGGAIGSNSGIRGGGGGGTPVVAGSTQSAGNAASNDSGGTGAGGPYGGGGGGGGYETDGGGSPGDSSIYGGRGGPGGNKGAPTSVSGMSKFGNLQTVATYDGQSSGFAGGCGGPLGGGGGGGSSDNSDGGGGYGGRGGDGAVIIRPGPNGAFNIPGDEWRPL